MLLPDTQRLLKANAVRELGARVAFNFTDLQQQGESYLADVRKQADALLQAAQDEAESIRHSARQEAQLQGRQDGLKESGRLIEEQALRLVEERMKERVAQTLPALAAIAQSLRQEKDEWLMRWETAAIQTAVAIAEKILHQTIETKPEAATQMIADVLKLAAGHPQLRIHLHPDDLAHLGQHAEDVVKSLTACADAALIADETIARGGCRIETRHGEIDARRETLLARITEELLA